MSQPKQQHYIPQFYLKFFASRTVAKGESYIWMYERNEECKHLPIKNVAKQNHIYSSKKLTGGYDTSIEQKLSKTESNASHILRKLNDAQKQLIISRREKQAVANFLSTLLARTPKARVMLEDVSNKFLHDSEQDWENQLNDRFAVTRLLRYWLIVFFRKLILFIPNGVYVLKGMLFRHNIKKAYSKPQLKHIMNRKMVLGKLGSSNRDTYITSDAPLIMYKPIQPREELKDYGDVFKHAVQIVIPIGSHTALIFLEPNSDNKGDKNKILVPFKEFGDRKAKDLNKMVISSAYRFLYSPWDNPKIKKIFDATTQSDALNASD